MRVTNIDIATRAKMCCELRQTRFFNFNGITRDSIMDFCLSFAFQYSYTCFFLLVFGFCFQFQVIEEFFSKLRSIIIWYLCWLKLNYTFHRRKYSFLREDFQYHIWGSFIEGFIFRTTNEGIERRILYHRI